MFNVLLPVLSFFAAPERPAADDPLGELVVEAAEGEDPRSVRRTRVALRVETPEFSAYLDPLTRDLELTGYLVVVPEEATPRPDRVVTLRVDGERWVAEIRSERGGEPDRTVMDEDSVRPLRVHRFADGLNEALSGVPSHFAGRLAVIRRSESTRMLFLATTDGDMRALTDDRVLVSSAGFDPNGRLHWTASTDRGRFALWQEGAARPLNLNPEGSVYGFAFHGDRFVAAIAVGARIELWEGLLGNSLRRRGRGPSSVSPTYTSPKAIATIEDGRGPPRVVLGGRAVSGPGRAATSVTACWDAATDRARVFWVEQGKRVTFILAAPSSARDAPQSVAWTGQGAVRSLACSPDGRTLVFGYVGEDLAGPGTYLAAAREGLWPTPVLIASEVATGLAWAPARR